MNTSNPDYFSIDAPGDIHDQDIRNLWADVVVVAQDRGMNIERFRRWATLTLNSRVHDLRDLTVDDWLRLGVQIKED